MWEKSETCQPDNSKNSMDAMMVSLCVHTVSLISTKVMSFPNFNWTICLLGSNLNIQVDVIPKAVRAIVVINVIGRVNKEDSLNLYRLFLLYLVNRNPNKVEAWVCSHSAFNEPRQLEITLPFIIWEKNKTKGSPSNFWN